MRSALIGSILLILSALTWAQSGSQAAPATKAPIHHAAAGPPIAVIDTTAGKMTCTLFPEKAPIGVENFIGLATGTKDWKNPVSGVTKHGVPLYDGTIFHRVIAGFMIQGGDPAGNGQGDPGYKFKNEVSSDLLFDRPGRLAYANSGPNTNGSQFFITEVPTPHLNHHHTIWGQCENLDVVKAIARVPRDANGKPATPVLIKHVLIERVGPAPANAPEGAPAQAAKSVAAPAKKSTP